MRIPGSFPVITSSAEYIYEPLSPNTVRILELLPPISPDDNLLQGNLLIEDLWNQPPYDALSYTWGEPIFTHSIDLQTGRVAITSNLAAALQQLKGSEARRIWVDAICINQSCDLERNAQVALMAEIYKNCERCIAWLGEGNEATRMIMTWLSSLAFSLHDRSISLDDLDYHVLPFEVVHVELLSLLALETSPHCQPSSLQTFLDQDWFRRLWILQEVALPPHVVLMNGSAELAFSNFTVAISALENLRSQGVDILQIRAETLQAAWDLANMRVITQDTQDQNSRYMPSGLLELVVTNASKHCLDDRDLIFGILGLYKEQKIHVHAEYSLGVRFVYENFVLEHLKQRDIKPLHYSGTSRNGINPFRDLEWPTWIPDWRYNEERRDARIGQHKPGKRFAASTSSLPTTNTKYSASGIIGLVGRCIDVVEIELSSMSHILGPAGSLGELFNDPHKILELRDLCEVMLSENVDEAFAQTLLLNSAEYLDIVHPGPDTILDCYLATRRDLENGTYRAMDFVRAAIATGCKRNFLITESKFIGLGPIPTKPGDIVVVFNSAETPFILREANFDRVNGGVEDPTNEVGDARQRKWEIIGDCYVHGFMNDETYELGYDEEMFWIV